LARASVASGSGSSKATENSRNVTSTSGISCFGARQEFIAEVVAVYGFLKCRHY
jgi:hypothetical protein